MSQYKGYNETYKKATMKYKKNNLERIALDVPKGKKELYRTYAEKRGLSLTAYIVQLIEADNAKMG